MGTNRNLVFKIGDENGMFPLPLVSKVYVEFRILHLAY